MSARANNSQPQTTQKPFTPNFERQSKIESNFKVLKKYEDSRFGPVAIIEVPGNNKRLMVREKVFTDKKEMAAEIATAEKRLSIGDPHLLAFVDYSTGSRSDFCSTNYWIKLFFEFPDLDIDVELRRRMKENLIGFTSSELTHMLYQTIHAGAVLNRSQLYHGDICPQTVEMDNPEYYKLVERFGELTKPEEFQQTRIIGGGDVYSAPEIYSRIKKGKGKTSIKGTLPSQAMMTADVYNLGMTILHAGTDEGVQAAYNPDGSINLEVLEKLKSHFARKFPENNLLVTTVYAMLEQDPTRRPADFITMESELPPYQVIQEALELEKRNTNSQFGYKPQPGVHGFQQGTPQAYNQYVGSTQWEQNWTPSGSQPARTTAPIGQSGSPLTGHLNIPRQQMPVPATGQATVSGQTNTTQPISSNVSGFGVVPPLGTGIPTQQPGGRSYVLPSTVSRPAPTSGSTLVPQTVVSQPFIPATQGSVQGRPAYIR